VQHTIVTGYAGGGLQLVRDALAGQSDDLVLGEFGAPAETVMGQASCTLSFCESDLFKAVDLADLARTKGIDLSLIVVLRDPRDLLLGLTGDGTALSLEELHFIAQFVDELIKAQIVDGLYILKAEDLFDDPDAFDAMFADILPAPLRAPLRTRMPAKGAVTPLSSQPLNFHHDGKYRAPWTFPQTLARLGELVLANRDIVPLVHDMDYETSPTWIGPVIAQARSHPDQGDLERDAAARDTFDVLYDDPLLRITFLPGEGKVAIITFIGVGLGTGGIDHQGEEFRKLGQGLGPQVFVFDKTRSWGNSVDMDLLLRVTQSLRQGRRVVTLGLSMGGFLAIHASGALGATACIAFAPQFSMHPDIAPFETRWARYRDQILDWSIPSLQTAFAEGCQYTCVFPDDPTDQHHAALFPAAPNVTRIMIGDGHHNVARALRDAGVLYPLLEACIDGTADLPLPPGARVLDAG